MLARRGVLMIKGFEMLQNSSPSQGALSGSSSISSLEVAAIQMVSCDEPAINFLSAKRLLEQVVENTNIRLVVFPENFLCFGASNIQKYEREFLGYLEEFKALATQHSVNLVLGSIPIIDPVSNKYFSRCFTINSLGNISDTYDKIHLFDVNVNDVQGQYRESDHYNAGGRTVVSCLAGVNVGLSICYDLRFPELYQALTAKGATMITVPAAFTNTTGKAHWELLLRARAVETQCYLIAANQGGTHSKGRETWGHSMIIDPWGRVISRLKKGEGACTALLDFEDLNAIRKSMNIQAHRRLI